MLLHSQEAQGGLLEALLQQVLGQVPLAACH